MGRRSQEGHGEDPRLSCTRNDRHDLVEEFRARRLGPRCVAVTGAPAQATGFGLYSVRGSYGYTLTGTVGDDPVSYVEAGLIVADGRGNLTAQGTAVIDGKRVVSTSYTCTYQVSGAGILSASCTSGRTQTQFVGPIVDRGLEAHYVAIPQDGSPSSLVGFARKLKFGQLF